MQPPTGAHEGEPTRSGPNKALVAAVLAVGLVIVLALVALVALVAVLRGGDAAPAEYCAAAAELTEELAAPQRNIDELRVLIDNGGRLAPADVVGAWQQLDQAVLDLEAEGAAARADEAANDIRRHSADSCD